jgi:hypothetical protein
MVLFFSRHSDFSSICQTTNMPHYSTCNSAKGAMTLSTTTTSIITFSIMNLIATFSMCLESHYSDCCYAGCHYAKCRYVECHDTLLVIVQTLLTLATLGQHDTNVCSQGSQGKCSTVTVVAVLKGFLPLRLY